MEMEGLEDFDYTQPLHYALSQLTGDSFAHLMPTDNCEESVHFPKPATLSAAATALEEENEEKSINQILDELSENFDNYPKLVTSMMQNGFLKKRQNCKKCDRFMTLRRRKNYYEWRCRTRDKKGDCSSCSIKTGSWFELSKLSFKAIFNFLIMHCKNCSTHHIGNELKLTPYSVLEVRKLIFELSERISRTYFTLGENGEEVFLEVISILTKFNSTFQVLAGQQKGSKKCFAAVLSDDLHSTFEKTKEKHVSMNARVTVVNTNKKGIDESYTSPDAVPTDESTITNDKFFEKLRRPLYEYPFLNEQILHNHLQDQVVRRTEGSKFLERCVEEIMNSLK